MRISTEINSLSKLVTPQKAIELVAKAGFDAWDFSMFDMARFVKGTDNIMDSDHPLHSANYAAYAKELRKIGEDCGIVCNQSHAPFPCRGTEMMYYLKRAIECTAEAGGKICIIHPANDDTPEKNAELYQTLLPFAKECGVKIATENMWNWTRANGLDQAAPAACSDPASFNAHLDAVNDDFLVACLDIGHAEMKGLGTSAPEMIRALGSRLQALHIHDNDKWHDSHEIPFSMALDWNAIVKALVDIDYQGYFTLECSYHLINAGYTAENVHLGVQNLADAAKKLAKMLVESDDPDVRTYLSQNIEEILIDNENIKITLVEH